MRPAITFLNIQLSNSRYYMIKRIFTRMIFADLPIVLTNVQKWCKNTIKSTFPGCQKSF